ASVRSSLHSLALSSSPYFLCLYPSRNHPGLHSFPTRRSSDLSRVPESELRADIGITPKATISGRTLTKALKDLYATNQFDDVGRSEEHTSELQSHLNLVCRLLLEKKKQTKNAIRNKSHTKNAD